MTNKIYEEESVSSKTLKSAALVSLFLAVIKAAAFVMSGSLLLLASLLDSIADSVTSFINFKLSLYSKSEPDQEHPFGHGGFEVAGSLVQGFIMIFFGLTLLTESVRRLFAADGSNVVVSEIPLAIGVLLFSALGGYVIQRFLDARIKKLDKSKERSLVLTADHAHYFADVIANVFAAIGLLLVFVTKINAFDTVFAMLAAGTLIRTAYPILKKCYHDIVHQEADPELQQKIVDIVLAGDPRIKGVHHLRSRELGPYLFVDFHMAIAGDISLAKAHDIGDEVEARILKDIPRADIIIHLDPDIEPEHNDWDISYKIPKAPSPDPL